MTTVPARVVRSLGLTGLVETAGDAPSFPPGVLYPYSRDIQRVCACCNALEEACPEAVAILLGETTGPVGTLSLEQATAVTVYMASVATLHSRIAFAPGSAGKSVGAAYRRATNALTEAPRRTRGSP